MHLLRTVVFSAALLLVLGIPSAAFAQSQGLGVFDPIWPEEGPCNCPDSAPDWGCALDIFDRVLDVAIGLGVVIAVLWIAYAGFSYMTYSVQSNPGGMESARTRLTNAVLGLAVILSAWVLVDFVMKALYNPEATFSGGNLGPWQEIWEGSEGTMCIQPNNIDRRIISGSLSLGPVSSAGGGAQSGSTIVTGGTGTCRVPTRGPCSPSNLQLYFGTSATQAAAVCHAESGGIISRASNTDIMRNDPQRRAFSFGLFQINITQHEINGLPCPQAFRGRNYSAVVVNESLYARCVAAAKNERINLQYASQLLQRVNGRWSPTWGAATRCGIR